MEFIRHLFEDLGTWNTPEVTQSLIRRHSGFNQGEFRANFSRYKPSERDEIDEHIARYKNSSRGINDYLRNDRDPALLGEFNPATHQALHKLTNFRTKQGAFHVFRGIRDEYSPRGTFFKNGNIIHDKGFTGTTLSPDIAYSFARNQNEPDFHGFYRPRTIAKINIPTGTKGHFLDMVPNLHDSEEEYLLHPGTHFKILGHSTHIVHLPENDMDAKVHVVHMTVHHQDD